jgi:hypothetical protein
MRSIDSSCSVARAASHQALELSHRGVFSSVTTELKRDSRCICEPDFATYENLEAYYRGNAANMIYIYSSRPVLCMAPSRSSTSITLTLKPMYKESNHVVEPLIVGSSENKNTINGLPQKRSKSSYRTTIALGVALATAVLLLNTGVLVWARSEFATDPDGIVTVYEGA